MSAGKGDKPRPVDSKAFAEGWERGKLILWNDFKQIRQA